MHYKKIKIKMKAIVRSPVYNVDLFDIVVRVFQRYTLAPYHSIICQDYTNRTSLDLKSENGLTLKKKKKEKRKKPTKSR